MTRWKIFTKYFEDFVIWGIVPSDFDTSLNTIMMAHDLHLSLDDLRVGLQYDVCYGLFVTVMKILINI